MNKASLTQSYQVYPKAQFSDQFYTIFFFIELKIGTEKIKSASSVKLLGVHIDDKLNFNHHINKLCKSAGNQLNAVTRLKSFLGLKERTVLVNSFIY